MRSQQRQNPVVSASHLGKRGHCAEAGLWSRGHTASKSTAPGLWDPKAASNLTRQKQGVTETVLPWMGVWGLDELPYMQKGSGRSLIKGLNKH